MKNIEENNNIINEIDIKDNSSKIIENKNDPSINQLLTNIFSCSKENPQILLPLLKKNCGCELKNIFNSPTENDSLINFIKNKISIINEIRKLITNKYEMIYIINNYLSKYDIIIFKYYIDLYLRLLLYAIDNDNEKINKDEIEKISKNIEELFVWFVNCGLLNKDITDYVFQNISAKQLEKKLNIDIFNLYIPLLEILYGKNIYNLHCDFIAKNYIYLFNKNTSIIKTNISPFNQIDIKNGLCIVLWFYLYEFCNEKEKSKGTICQIITKDLQKIDIILNNNFDLDIKYNTKELLKEKKGNKFNIKTNIWTQLKIQFTDNKIHLFLCQNNDENKSELKYEMKTYLINYDNKKSKKNKNYNNNIFNMLKLNNTAISYLNFFMGYEGLVGTILFYNNANYDKKNKLNTIRSVSGLDNDKINHFIKKINLKDIYFIISPSLYCSEENKFKDTTNNIEVELSLENNENYLNLNSVINIYNYTKNIFYLGGCRTILPLFEIIYRFSYEFDKKNEDLKKNDEKMNNSANYQLIISKICATLNKLFKFLELIFINKKRNCIEAYKNSTHFFESLQLFLENINEKYYNFDDSNNKSNISENCIISSLLNIGKYFYEIKNKKIIEEKEKHGYFANILFYPTIVMKFDINKQNIIFSFFEVIKKDNIFFKNNEYKAYFIPWNKIVQLLTLFSNKYKDNFIPSNLFNIIKIIFEDYTTTDNEREDLLLLYNKNLVTDNVFINIMEIFINYFDINTNIKDKNEILDKENIIKNSEDKYEETTINLRNNSIKYLLYSPNFFIEYLLNILLTKNLLIKKLVIDFLRIITNKYYPLLEEYFIFVNECNKTYKNKRINKNDFYFFIKENIIINEYNEKIINEFEINKLNSKKNRKNKRKESIIEEKNNIIKIDDIEDLSANKRTKSIDLQLDKNQRKKILNNMTKKKKKIKFSIKNNAHPVIKKKSNSIKLKKNEKNKLLDDISNEMSKYQLYQKNGNFVFRKRNKSGTNLNKITIDNNDLNIKKLKENKTKYSNAYSSKNIHIKNEKLKIINNIEEKGNDINFQIVRRNNRSLTVFNTNNKIGKQLNIKKKKHRNKKRTEKKNNKNTFINEIDFEEDTNINCDISMILYEWLISINQRKIESTNSKTTTIDLIHKVLNFFTKFLSNTTQLEVIHKTLSNFTQQKISDNNNKKSKNNYIRLLS
jgi:hypothetical protein